MKKYAILALTAVMATSILTVPAKALPTQPQGITNGGCVIKPHTCDYCLKENEEDELLAELPDERLLTCQFGDNNIKVKVLQCILYQMDYEDLGEVKVFGPETQRAVEDIQAKHGLAVNGIVDSETWEVIEEAYSEYLNN